MTNKKCGNCKYMKELIKYGVLETFCSNLGIWTSKRAVCTEWKERRGIK